MDSKSCAAQPWARGLFYLSWFNLLATAVLIAAWSSFGRDWPVGLFELLGAWR